uniref:Uncharacterized protein n=1 Tax=Serinus canaria TaxID=9135 RepID=A0A8C9MKT1_SERCA
INIENLEIVTSKCLNPAQFLTGEPMENLEHNSIEIIEIQTKVREDLEEDPLPYGRVLCIDGSSQILMGKRASGYAIIEAGELKEKGKLPSNWSAQSLRRPAHTRLPMLLLIHFGGSGGNTCEKCYYPLYRGDTLSVLIRVHTNMNPKCIDHSQLTTCKKDNKIYWLAKNIANPSQRISGERPMKESWVCFEQESETNLEDTFKEKEVQLKRQRDKEGQIYGKNPFVNMVEKITKEFNLTDCWVCGGTHLSEIWRWDSITLSPLDILKWITSRKRMVVPKRMEGKWKLKSTIIGEECLSRKGQMYTTEVGETPCKRYQAANDTHTTRCVYSEKEKMFECLGDYINPFWAIETLSKYWKHITNQDSNFWDGSKNLFWICGNTVYVKLPGGWTRSCTIGAIKPSFFLLSLFGETQNWNNEIWTLQKIINTYGSATWAQDGSWGHRTPVYMLNQIIRLQAVLEKMSNQTTLTIDLLNQQQQTRSVLYQIRLAVDYLLAGEGGICGKFNTSECCLEIHDHGHVIKNITQNIRKLPYEKGKQYYLISFSCVFLLWNVFGDCLSNRWLFHWVHVNCFDLMTNYGQAVLDSGRSHEFSLLSF